MPGGDPGLLEQLAAQLEAIAEGSGNLGASTHQATTAIRSDAEWTGDAADAYTAFTGNLAQGVVATQAPLSRIAEAVRGYAGFLRTAQDKVAAYSSAAEVAQVSGNDSGYVGLANSAAQAADAAVSACQAAAGQAAAEVAAASGRLSEVFGTQGPVQGWLTRQSTDGDTLAGFPGFGGPTGPGMLKTPGAELGPQILKTPGAELGPEILITLPGEFGPEILKTPGAELGTDILKTPPGELWPLINYSKGHGEGGAENEEIARTIAGHAQAHFPGGTEDAAETIQDVLNSRDSLVRGLANDRTAYYNDGVIVIKNPKVPYWGTAFEGDLDDFLRLR
jgi:uncharacterized protein YukE